MKINYNMTRTCCLSEIRTDGGAFIYDNTLHLRLSEAINDGDYDYNSIIVSTADLVWLDYDTEVIPVDCEINVSPITIS